MDAAIDYYDLAEQIAKRQVQIDDLQKEVTELKGYFRGRKTERFDREGKISITVKVTPNKRIDDSLARENLEPDVYDAVSKKTIDTAKARAHLTDAQLEAITKVYDNKVEVTF